MPNYLMMLMPVVVLLAAAVAVLPRRLRMERRAKALLAQMPNNERRTIYLAFTSGWYRGKEKEMTAKISEEARTGWTFLKASEANVFRTSRSWGGGVNLHFIRKS